MPATEAEYLDVIDKLHTAIANIADPIKGWYPDGVKLAPSLLDQLGSDVAARPGERAGRFHAASTPPVFVDALQLRTEIDDTIRQFDPAGTTTLDRLRRIASGRWRPQDAERLEQLTADLERWTAAIKALLDPVHIKTFSAACPACNATTSYRTNGTGERVRQPALQLIASIGCRCMNCDAFWPPEKFLFLASVLGMATPTGVIG